MESHPELEFSTRRYARWANQIDRGRDGLQFSFKSRKAPRPLRLIGAQGGAGGSQDVLVNGGEDIARQFVNAGLLDEVRLHLVPVVLGADTSTACAPTSA